MLNANARKNFTACGDVKAEELLEKAKKMLFFPEIPPESIPIKEKFLLAKLCKRV